MEVNEFHLLLHQVVEEDVRGLGRQVADVEQELPQHVHQLVLASQHKKYKSRHILHLPL